MLINDQTIRINNNKIRISEGTCKTGNICYIAVNLFAIGLTLGEPWNYFTNE